MGFSQQRILVAGLEIGTIALEIKPDEGSVNFSQHRGFDLVADATQVFLRVDKQKFVTSGDCTPKMGLTNRVGSLCAFKSKDATPFIIQLESGRDLLMRLHFGQPKEEGQNRDFDIPLSDYHAALVAFRTQDLK